MTYKKRPWQDRFWEKVCVSDGCWLWTDELQATGYAGFWRNGKTLRAHRVSYEMHVGPIPDGLLVDHICQVRHCVRPSHLRLATYKQNSEHQQLRSDNTSGYRGVSWDVNKECWVGLTKHAGKQVFVGSFDNPEDANYAVVQKRIELFTHNNEDREFSEKLFPKK